MANGKDKTYYEIEIRRVETALKNTKSCTLQRDYGKYLKKLYRESLQIKSQEKKFKNQKNFVGK